VTGTRQLAGLIWRRDRMRLPIWIYVLIALVLGSAASLRSLYKTVEGRESFAATIVANPAIRAVTGTVFNASSTGGLTAWRVMCLGGIVTALMSILTVVRHTRAEEDAGRTELIGAGVVGRLAPLTAVLVVVAAANLVGGLLCALGMIAFGTGAAGSFALGLALAFVGIAFAGVAAIAVQLPENSRTANGIACAALGVAFALRAAGDSGTSSWLSWLSPLGWGELVRPYASERWWVFGLFVAFTAVCVSAAYALVGRRDLGAGLLPDRLGPASAPRTLRSTFGLAVRQHRGAMIGWGIGMLAFGAFVGAAAKGAASIVDSSHQMDDILTKLGGYLQATLGIGGAVAAAYGVQATLRPRAEETAGRAESVLATPASRWRWMGSHVLLALVGTGLLLLVTGVGAGLTYGIAVHDVGGQLKTLIETTLVQWPAAAVLVGVTAAGFGFAPRATWIGWGLLVAFVLIGQLGPLFGLSRTVQEFSPFEQVPTVPLGAGASMDIVSVSAFALVCAGAGMVGFRRRDVG
jgi:polyether ionophore transport system permease protein